MYSMGNIIIIMLDIHWNITTMRVSVPYVSYVDVLCVCVCVVCTDPYEIIVELPLNSDTIIILTE